MLHSLFDKSRLQNSELLATGINLVIQLLTSFEGKQMYPKNEKKSRSLQTLQKTDKSVQME
ncbi:MAG: hypothetical protein K2K89_11370 [Ruminococcus sp.]|nr:hypothetical protein [Ruminococcus sp.]